MMSVKTSQSTGLKHSNRSKQKISTLEALFAQQAKALKLEFVREYRFHETRRWRFDFADLTHKIAIEIEGGVWSNGRHTRGSGFIADCEKYNHAVLEGWRVFRFTGEMVRSGQAVHWVQRMLATCHEPQQKREKHTDETA